MLALMDGPDEAWGRRLRHWRRDRMHWSQHDLVERIVRLAYESNEERGTSLDVRLLSRWENGRVRQPQAVYRRLLTRLGAPLPASTTASVRAQDVGREPDERSSHEVGEPPVLRRDFLRAGTSLAVPGLLGVLMDSDAGRVRPRSELVEELEHRLIALRKLDTTLGGADTYRLYATEVELTGRLLQNGSIEVASQRRLLALHAEQSQQAGWAAFDAGRQDLAHAHFLSSHAAAVEAGDPGLAGNALALHAYQLIGLGRPARAVSERSIRAAARPGVDPGVRALLHSRAAWTFALDGDVDATARCLGHAEEAFASADGRTPDYAAWIDETELAIMTGRCWSELRRPLRAVPVLESALGGYSDAHSRDKALYSSWLADSYLDAGEIEKAATVVETSLAAVVNTSSARPRERLAAVAARLAEHRDLPAVRDLLAGHPLHPRDVRR